MDSRKTTRILTAAISAMLLWSCTNDGPTTFEPQLTANAATDITRTGAVLQGTVTLTGSTTMPEVCFRYGTTTAMEQSTASYVPDASTFAHSLTSLTPGTTYYYAVRATNGKATLESAPTTFTTMPNDSAKVDTLRLLSYGPMSVITAFDVPDDGGEEVTQAGCYVTEDINASQPDKGCTKYESSINANATGTIRVRINYLEQGKSYRIWPYVVTRVGEVIGQSIVFTTSSAVCLEQAGELASLIGSDMYGYKTITLAGDINGDDIACLRRMLGIDTDGTATAGTLEEIDMTDVNITADGGTYDGEHFASADVIGQGMFASCTNLKKITLPSSATAIEKDAFAGCTGLQELSIPASASSITPSAGCTNLQHISVSGGNTAYQSIDGVLLNGDATEILWFPMGKTGEYTLPATITEIGDYAFSECGITHFILPDNITEIGRGVFYGSKVEEVTMPSKLKMIPTGTFQKCSKLKTVTLGAATNLISDYAFDGCPLTTLYVLATTPPVCSTNTFTNSEYPQWTSTCTLYVPKGRKQYYRLHSQWQTFISSHIKELD